MGAHKPAGWLYLSDPLLLLVGAWGFVVQCWGAAGE